MGPQEPPARGTRPGPHSRHAFPLSSRTRPRVTPHPRHGELQRSGLPPWLMRGSRIGGDACPSQESRSHRHPVSHTDRNCRPDGGWESTLAKSVLLTEESLTVMQAARMELPLPQGSRPQALGERLYPRAGLNSRTRHADNGGVTQPNRDRPAWLLQPPPQGPGTAAWPPPARTGSATRHPVARSCASRPGVMAGQFLFFYGHSLNPAVDCRPPQPSHSS